MNNRIKPKELKLHPTITSFIHSFIHSVHICISPSSPQRPGAAPDYSTDPVAEFHAKAPRQLQVKDLPKVPRGGTWWRPTTYNSFIFLISIFKIYSIKLFLHKSLNIAN